MSNLNKYRAEQPRKLELIEYFSGILATYNTEKVSVENAFLDNRIKFSDNYGDNSYKILTSDGEWTNHPHWAALGYVLKQKNYPGFNGNWTDLNYVKPFLKNNFDITVD